MEGEYMLGAVNAGSFELSVQGREGGWVIVGVVGPHKVLSDHHKHVV